MIPLPKHASYLFTLLAIATCTGCQTANTTFDQPPLTYPDVPDRPRSIVTDAPHLRSLTVGQSRAIDTSWYTWRNDVQRSTYAGYQSPTHDHTVTITRDRQTITNGRVHDHLSTTTHTIRSTTRTR